MSSKSGASKPSIEVSPFLRLPLEVRLLIYLYLVPNVGFDSLMFISGPTRRSSTKFRSDCEVCCPEILRVNRQIYQEAVKEFYEHAQFQMIVLSFDRNSAAYYFLGRTYRWDELPPPAFSHVKHLKLAIRFERRLDAQRGDQIATIVQNCFMQQQRCLENLDIEIRPDRELWAWLLGNEEMLTDTLDLYLSPLKGVRGLLDVTATGNMHISRFPKGFGTNEFTAKKNGILTSIKNALDELAQLMMLPFQLDCSS